MLALFLIITFLKKNNIIKLGFNVKKIYNKYFYFKKKTII